MLLLRVDKIVIQLSKLFQQLLPLCLSFAAGIETQKIDLRLQFGDLLQLFLLRLIVIVFRLLELECFLLLVNDVRISFLLLL